MLEDLRARRVVLRAFAPSRGVRRSRTELRRPRDGVHDQQAPLEPSVLPGEECNYVPGKSAEAQMMFDMSNPLARAKAGDARVKLNG